MRAFVICILLVVLAGCTSKISEVGLENGIAGEYTFSQDSRFAGRPLTIGNLGADLFIMLDIEDHKMPLVPEDSHYRFTTEDMVWNADKTAKELEWFIIAYDTNRKQYYLGAPENTEWRQYLKKN